MCCGYYIERQRRKLYISASNKPEQISTKSDYLNSVFIYSGILFYIFLYFFPIFLPILFLFLIYIWSFFLPKKKRKGFYFYSKESWDPRKQQSKWLYHASWSDLKCYKALTNVGVLGYHLRYFSLIWLSFFTSCLWEQTFLFVIRESPSLQQELGKNSSICID